MAAAESDDRLAQVVSLRQNLAVDVTYGVHPAAGCVAEGATPEDS
jgi:NAD/NADP transhydrogenase beta subunit